MGETHDCAFLLPLALPPDLPPVILMDFDGKLTQRLKPSVDGGNVCDDCGAM